MTTELLHRENFFSRLREIREAGGRAFRMDVGKTNSEYEIRWFPKEVEVPQNAQTLESLQASLSL